MPVLMLLLDLLMHLYMMVLYLNSSLLILIETAAKIHSLRHILIGKKSVDKISFSTNNIKTYETTPVRSLSLTVCSSVCLCLYDSDSVCLSLSLSHSLTLSLFIFDSLSFHTAFSLCFCYYAYLSKLAPVTLS